VRLGYPRDRPVWHWLRRPVQRQTGWLHPELRRWHHPEVRRWHHPEVRRRHHPEVRRRHREHRRPHSVLRRSPQCQIARGRAGGGCHAGEAGRGVGPSPSPVRRNWTRPAPGHRCRADRNRDRFVAGRTEHPGPPAGAGTPARTTRDQDPADSALAGTAAIDVDPADMTRTEVALADRTRVDTGRVDTGRVDMTLADETLAGTAATGRTRAESDRPAESPAERTQLPTSPVAPTVRPRGVTPGPARAPAPGRGTARRRGVLGVAPSPAPRSRFHRPEQPGPRRRPENRWPARFPPPAVGRGPPVRAAANRARRPRWDRQLGGAHIHPPPPDHGGDTALPGPARRRGCPSAAS
jgi:hypothetical protein